MEIETRELHEGRDEKRKKQYLSFWRSVVGE
jgi:hypothetical protein